ncbi:MAG: penicillin-binding protein 2 [Rudaea sp.]|uniref:peptidoglycan D,D-transpeptidase FtsI family protein n=1 Tax=unclassified Rudaea TaxID=2627037 RepID=UPI0010F6616D|nr:MULTISPECIES: penicillin-binding protein 2 [unclassified Rudaea]MBN8887353.1 penicillin-binding protein 2 [Rudaea sp.]
MTKRELFQFDLPMLRAQREAQPAATPKSAPARGAKRWFDFVGDTPKVKPRQTTVNLKRRLYSVLMILALAGTALIVRAVDLQWVSKDFYLDQGDQRYARDIKIDAPRGTIFDRNGNPLAVSTPVASIWADPSTLKDHMDRIPELAKALNLDANALAQKITQKADKQFVYLVRHLNPDAAEAIVKLGIPGVDKQAEFRRFYPNGEVTAHILGKTNVDDVGSEGLELAFNEYLAGKPGSKSVIRDLHNRAVESYDVDLDVAPKPGRDLTLSIDKNIQYLAYRELMQAIKDHHSAYGSIVVLDVTNGEVVAMVNQPSFNPNSQNGGNIPPADLLSHMRNRAVTDVIEPGSTMKAFTVAAAFESGKWKPDSKVDTSPGTYQFYGHTIHDTANHGVLTVAGVIKESSNIGAAKIAETLPREMMYDVFHRFGFGETTGSGFTGESPGNLPTPKRWGPVEKATISYGYGLSVTPLQLARGYATIANGGILHEPTFVKGGGDAGKRVIDQKIADEIIPMLRSVVAEGTGRKAQVSNYFAGGKTGTSRIASRGGYNSIYNSLFVGFVPASNPRLVCAIVISGSSGATLASYSGGMVAAPSFGKVMEGALRTLDIAPDDVKNWYAGGPGPNPLVAPKDILPPDPTVPADMVEEVDP